MVPLFLEFPILTYVFFKISVHFPLVEIMILMNKFPIKVLCYRDRFETNFNRKYIKNVNFQKWFQSIWS